MTVKKPIIQKKDFLEYVFLSTVNYKSLYLNANTHGNLVPIPAKLLCDGFS